MVGQRNPLQAAGGKQTKVTRFVPPRDLRQFHFLASVGIKSNNKQRTKARVLHTTNP